MTLNEELAAVEAEIAKLETVRDWLRGRMNGKAPARTSRPKGKLTAAAAAEQVLRGRGEPMKTPDLLREVQAAGAKMADCDGMYKTLDRDKVRFKKVARGVWGLADRD